MDFVGDTPQLLLWLIGICVAVMLVLVFARSKRAVVKAVVRGAAGALAMLAINAAAVPVGLAVGLNVFTVALVGVLGAPGLLLLYAMGWVL